MGRIVPLPFYRICAHLQKSNTVVVSRLQEVCVCRLPPREEERARLSSEAISSSMAHKDILDYPIILEVLTESHSWWTHHAGS